MMKILVKIKSLGSSMQEPIYCIQYRIGNKDGYLITNLDTERFKAEGRFIKKFFEDTKDLDLEQPNVATTEKELFMMFLDVLRTNNIKEIVVQDKLKDMLYIEERMKANKFKVENFRFRNFILSEEKDNSFFKEEKDSTSTMMELINKVKKYVK